MTIFVKSFGKGPDLVFLHGWGFNGGIWDDLINPLVALGYCIHVVDLPGHGHSPILATALTLDDWAEAVRKVVPAGSVWIGWSLGGMVALAAAILDPTGICMLVLVGSSPRFVRDDDWQTAIDPKFLSEFACELRKDWRATLSRFLAMQIRSSAVMRRARATVLVSPPAPSALAMGLTMLQNTDLRPRLAHVRCPTLVLLGERDTLVPAAISTDLARLCPTWKIRQITGAGHLPFLTHQDEFLAILLKHV